MGKQQDDEREPHADASGHARPAARQRPRRAPDALRRPASGEAAAALRQEQEQQADRREDDRDRRRAVERAVELELVDLRRQERLGLGEEQRRREGRHREHEHEQARAEERRPEVREHDAPERARAAGAEVRARVEQRSVEVAQGGAREEEEVDLEDVHVDRHDGPDPGEAERRGVQPEQRLEAAREHPALTVEEHEGEHAHERRQRQRQRGGARQKPAHRQPHAVERPRQPHADGARAENCRERHADGVDEGARARRAPAPEQVREHGGVQPQPEGGDVRPQHVPHEDEPNRDGERACGAAAQDHRSRRLWRQRLGLHVAYAS